MAKVTRFSKNYLGSWAKFFRYGDLIFVLCRYNGHRRKLALALIKVPASDFTAASRRRFSRSAFIYAMTGFVFSEAFYELVLRAALEDTCLIVVS
jgi:hypothetical protein